MLPAGSNNNAGPLHKLHGGLLFISTKPMTNPFVVAAAEPARLRSAAKPS
jgi:hypothetical protein